MTGNSSGNNNSSSSGDGNDLATRANHILDKVFRSCADDPKASVHRAWGVSLLFFLIFAVLSVFESEYMCVFITCIFTV